MTRALTLIAAIVLVLAGCGSDDEPLATDGGAGDDPSGTTDASGDDDTGTTDDRATIEGEYRSVAVTENGEPLPLFEDTDVSLRLLDGDLRVQADCNHIGGAYSIDDGVLHVDTVTTTDMGCDGPRHDRDEWLADLLASDPVMEPVEEGFVLTAGDRSIDFRDESYLDPDPAGEDG